MGHKRIKIDWEPLELDWRLGILSVRDMAKKYNSGGYGNTTKEQLSYASIHYHFTNAEITRDTVARHAAKIAALNNQPRPIDPEAVGKALVAATYALDNNKELTQEQLAIATDSVLTANVLIAHKADIGQARGVAAALFKELEAAMSDPQSTLTTRATVCKTLTDALQKLIALERQAFNIPDVAPEAASTPAQAELSHDTARRFAFVLMQAAKAKVVQQ